MVIIPPIVRLPITIKQMPDRLYQRTVNEPNKYASYKHTSFPELGIYMIFKLEKIIFQKRT
jgi:hypothetical protein